MLEWEVPYLELEGKNRSKSLSILESHDHHIPPAIYIYITYTINVILFNAYNIPWGQLHV